MKILVVGGISSSLVNFRGPLIRAMLAKGHEVFACAADPVPEAMVELSRWGAQYIRVPLARTAMRLWEDLDTLATLYRLMRRIRPDVVLAYTIKPVVWGGLAAQLARIPTVFSMLEGLGYAFTPSPGFRRSIAKEAATVLYRFALPRSRAVFFLNPDDIDEFVERRLVRRDKCVLVNGTGIDLDFYAPAPLPKKPRFLMICRLLQDKGVREYVAAARFLRANYPEASFALAGPLDYNPSGISFAEVEAWHREGLIEYLGVLRDVRPALANAAVYVLPSYYREGVPRTLLEAMSMGRPAITTNAPGCRETIVMPSGYSLNKESREMIRGENGFLIPTKNIEKLVQAMEQFILKPVLVEKMGRRSRELAEKKYDVHRVNKVIMETMGLEPEISRQLTTGSSRGPDETQAPQLD